jgi:hypothetical protein
MNIDCLPIKNLIEHRKGNANYVLRVVRWKYDGKISPPRLERRSLYSQQDGTNRNGKCQGLTLADMDFVASHWDEIRPLLVDERPQEPTQEPI